MSQIFMSHSGRDTGFIDPFKNIFSTSKVMGVLEEYERMLGKRVTAEKIRIDIFQSAAVFLLLTENVQNIPYTRDWVVWESGNARNKPLWLFEPVEQFGRNTVVIPHVTHHVIYGPGEGWLRYLKNIVESYDNSNALPAFITGTIILGAVFNPLIGLVGGAGGLMVSTKSNLRPAGKLVCCGRCRSQYRLHYPIGMTSTRCPVCNNVFSLQPCVQGGSNATANIASLHRT
jgi:LSD1 subclass zinc finger protein